MEAAATVEAKKDGLKQMQSGEWTLVLKVHPNDMPSWLLTAPMGQRLALVVAALHDEQNAGAAPPGAAAPSGPVSLDTGAPIPSPSPKEGAPGGRTPWSQMKASQQAGILASDDAFCRWAFENGRWPKWVTNGAEMIRFQCGVESRRDLDTDPEARRRWDALVAEYRMANGQMAEQRS